MSKYDFTSLSPYDFELLSGDLIGRDRNIQLQYFKSGRDKGIDLRYAPDKANTLIVQCKHYVGSGYDLLFSHLKNDELPKIKKLNPKKYILVTSVALSPGQTDNIVKLLSPYCSTSDDLIGAGTLNALLRKYPTVEQAHFKLWLTSTRVLSTVLNHKSWIQSDLEKDEIENTVKLYVATASAMTRAQELLKTSHCCIISGPPGIGKTTLARILMVQYVADGWTPVVIRNDIAEGFDVFERDPTLKQVFYYDDFLGQVAVGEKLGKNEDKALYQFLGAVNKAPNKRFVLTTREYILAQAKMLYEVLSRGDLDANKCILELKDYTRGDRGKILLNHLFFHSVPQEYVAELVRTKTYKTVIDHDNYSPRLIEAMTDKRRIAAIKSADFPKFCVDTLDHPLALWSHAFDNQLKLASRSFLTVAASCGDYSHLGDLEAAFAAFHFGRAKALNFSTDPADFRTALKECDGSFVKTSRFKSGVVCEFHNPSVMDFLTGFIRENGSEVSALCDHAVYFEQLERIVSILVPEEMTTSSCAALNTSSSQLVSAVIRLLNGPSCQLTPIVYAGGRREYAKKPVSKWSRILFLITLSEHWEDKAIRETAVSLAKSALAGAGVEHADTKVVVELLEGIHSATWIDSKGKDECINSAKDVVKGSFSSVSAAIACGHCIELYSTAFSADDRAAYSAKADDVCRTDVSDLVGQEDDPEVLRTVSKGLTFLEREFDLDFADEISELDDEADRLEGNDPDDSRVEDRWHGEIAAQPVDDEEARLDSMFESLLGSRANQS